MDKEEKIFILSKKDLWIIIAYGITLFVGLLVEWSDYHIRFTDEGIKMIETCGSEWMSPSGINLAIFSAVVVTVAVAVSMVLDCAKEYLKRFEGDKDG